MRLSALSRDDTAHPGVNRIVTTPHMPVYGGESWGGEDRDDVIRLQFEKEIFVLREGEERRGGGITDDMPSDLLGIAPSARTLPSGVLVCVVPCHIDSCCPTPFESVAHSWSFLLLTLLLELLSSSMNPGELHTVFGKLGTFALCELRSFLRISLGLARLVIGVGEVIKVVEVVVFGLLPQPPIIPHTPLLLTMTLLVPLQLLRLLQLHTLLLPQLLQQHLLLEVIAKVEGDSEEVCGVEAVEGKLEVEGVVTETVKLDDELA